jgi:hypothetical protein
MEKRNEMARRVATPSLEAFDAKAPARTVPKCSCGAADGGNDERRTAYEEFVRGVERQKRIEGTDQDPLVRARRAIERLRRPIL